MTLTKEIIQPYLDSFSMREIAGKFNTNPSIISKIKAGKIKKCRVGIKSKHAATDYIKIWEIIPPEQFMFAIKKESVLMSYQSWEWYYDFFMDYWTTRLEEHSVIKRLREVKNKLAYFRTVTKRLVFSHSFKKTKAYKKTIELQANNLDQRFIKKEKI